MSLDKQVAEALGLKLATHFNFVPRSNTTYLATGKSYPEPVATIYSPSTNWEQGGKLIEEHKISVEYRSALKEEIRWFAKIGSNHGVCASGSTPLIAACKALAASKDK